MTTETQACSIEGCKRPYRAKGFCNTHFKKWRAGETPRKRRHKNCTESGCHKTRGVRGLCEEHYKAWADARKPQAPAAPAPAAPAPEAAAAPAEAKE